jgi:hypothetical protein
VTYRKQAPELSTAPKGKPSERERDPYAHMTQGDMMVLFLVVAPMGMMAIGMLVAVVAVVIMAIKGLP